MCDRILDKTHDGAMLRARYLQMEMDVAFFRTFFGARILRSHLKVRLLSSAAAEERPL